MDGSAVPRISVVMPTYNRRDGLETVVRPVLDDPATAEVVVVVDGCADGSLELLQSWAADDPRVVPVYQENAGQAGARQRGIETAAGEVVVLLDDDVRVGHGTITAHGRWHSGHPHRLVLGYMPMQGLVRRAGHAASVLYAEDYEKTCREYEADPRHVLTGLWGGNLSLRRADALRIGLRADLGLRYHEDQEFGFRCLVAGLEPVFDRRLTATHLHARSLDELARECRDQGAARVVLAEHYPELAPGRDPTDDLSPAWRAVVRAARRPNRRGRVTHLLEGVGRQAGRTRLEPVELAAARLLRQLELDRGARRAAGAVTG